MAQFRRIFYQDLTKKRIIRHCEDVVFGGDNLSDKIGVYLYDNGEPYAGGGTVSGTVINSRGQTVPITTGEISGNLITVTLEEAALAVPGIIGVYVKLTSGQQIATVLGAMFTAMPTETDQTIDPGTIIPSVSQLITDIETARNSIPPVYTELLAAVAPTFSASTAYTAGSYVWQGGNLYRFTADHPAGTWTGTDAVQVSLADDLWQQVSDLRSAFDVLGDYTENSLQSIETVINGKPQIYADYQSGRYLQNGYTNSFKDYVNSKNLLEAGTYSFVTTMGNAYYFGLFQYVSDTSGVVVQGLNDINRLNQVVPEGTKVTVRKMAGTPITEEDIKYIHENLKITKITNETNIIDSIDDINDHIDRIVTQGNLFDIKSVEYGKALSSGTLADVADRITSDYIDVHYLNQIYHSGTTLQLAFYDQNKTFVSQVQNPASPFSTIVYNKNVFYIRVTIHPDDASTYYICPTATAKHDYMFYPTHGIGGIDCSEDFAKLSHDNSIDSSDTFTYSANTWVGCSGNLVFDHTLGEANGMYAINTVGTMLDLRRTLETPIDPTGICEIYAYVYIPDATKITDITLYALGTSFSRTTRVFANGWNKLRFATYEGALTTWANITAIRLYVTGETGLEIVFAKCTFTRPNKANLIIIEDGGYSTFLEIGYPKFKAINVPITWALNPGRLGATSGTSGHVLTQEEIDSIAYDACSEFSFHSWNSTPTQNMTASEIQEDAIKCIRYLKKQGLCPQYLWRAAHVQNLATNASAEEGFVEALATGTAVSAYTTWPFVNRYNVPRTPFHGRNASYYTAMFDVMKKTHCTAVIYTHGVSDYSADITVDLLDEFITQLTTAIGEGWINPTTYNRLRNETLVID